MSYPNVRAWCYYENQCRGVWSSARPRRRSFLHGGWEGFKYVSYASDGIHVRAYYRGRGLRFSVKERPRRVRAKRRRRDARLSHVTSARHTIRVRWFIERFDRTRALCVVHDLRERLEISVIITQLAIETACTGVRDGCRRAIRRPFWHYARNCRHPVHVNTVVQYAARRVPLDTRHHRAKRK